MVPACAAMPTFFFFLTYILATACVCVDKSEDDVERESQLLECRLTLTEERNAVLVPSAGSGIPGAPVERFVCVCAFKQHRFFLAIFYFLHPVFRKQLEEFVAVEYQLFFLLLLLCRVPVPGMETHVPVLFLDLSGTLPQKSDFHSTIAVH